jgi:hypothetical protein
MNVIQKQINGIQNQLNVFQNNVQNALQDLNARLTAASQNVIIRSMNKFEGPALNPLCKEIAGSGDALVALIIPNQVAPPPQLAQIPAVGAQPGPMGAGGIFPDDLDILLNLTHNQVLHIVQFYNDDFGILPGDNIVVRRRKLMRRFQ